MRRIIFVLIMIISCPAYADQRTDKVEALMRVQGLLEIWQQQIDIGKIEGEKRAKIMIDQILTQLNPSEQFKKRFEKAFTVFIAKLQDNWTAQQIVDTWAKFYGPRFTDAELDQLISFYTSEIGRKDIKETKAAMIKFTQYFQQESQPIVETALNEYIAELRIVVKECKCPKKN